MNCIAVRPLLSAHLDEELDVVNDAAVATHLETCAACAALVLELSDQRRAVREKLSYHRAPADFAAQLRAAVWESSGSETTPVGKPGKNFARRVPRSAWWTGLAAAAAFAVALGFFGGREWQRRENVVATLASAHARARLTGHVIDVESSDRHTVKPWFVGKVNFAPAVPDLAAGGFPLRGGRLEQLGERTVATLVYARHQHSVEVHVWTGEPAPVSGTTARDGYVLTGWREGSLNFTAVTDASRKDLREFRQLFQAASN